MTLLYRIKRLVKADAHALVEGLEEPKWILAQAIRDMEEELEKQGAALEEKKEKWEKIHKSMEQIGADIASKESDIDLAIDEKREDIAKHLIKANIINRKSLETLADQKNVLSKDLERLEKEVKEKQKAYSDVCARSQNISFETVKSDAFDEAKKVVGKDSSLDHEVELEFLRRIKKRSSPSPKAMAQHGGKNEK